ncbi:craniofacial development protein 2-like [Halyomorpha halys]|uniref:craniofacial development protein 2-like n=1 Tax=Halyomorpha halys TaxID=286706 RepID=UPI0006D50B3D|nr:uncharacterized protein LOC106687439 [Halyomorpha halys]
MKKLLTKNNYPKDKVERLDSMMPDSEKLKHDESEHHKYPTQKFRPKNKYYFGTYNIDFLIQVGKLKQIRAELKRLKISVMGLQETRYTDTEALESGDFKIYKGPPDKKIMRGMPHLGTAFIVDKKFLNTVVGFKEVSSRLSLLTKKYTTINAHAPINEDNKKNSEKVEQFWEILEKEMIKIPQNHVKILLGDYNAQIGKEKRYNNIVGEYPAHKWTNRNGERLVQLCKISDLKLMLTHYRTKPVRKRRGFPLTTP